MQKMVAIKDLYRDPIAFKQKKVVVGGWVRTIRDQKQFGFIQLNDGTFFKSLQVVFERETLDNYEEVSHYGNGSAIICYGEIIETPGAKQAFEMKATKIELEGASPPDYPLQPKRHSLEFMRSLAHLRSRTNLYAAVFRVRSEVAFAIHQFFHSRNFVYVHTPIITSSDAEGAGEMFAVTTFDPNQAPLTEDQKIDYKQDFFGKKTSLTVSGQLSGETFALAFKNIYTFGPTFRAEHSNTAKHAAEFWMIEPEMAFADLEDDMDVAEAMIKYIITYVLKQCPEEMEFFNSFVDKGLLERLHHVISNDFDRMTYTDAITVLEKVKDRFTYPVYWGADLQTEHERYLTEEHCKKPVFIIDYPKEIKAFYMKENSDGKTVAAMDCLVPGIGEIIGGSQREENMEILKQKLKDNHLDENEYWWYLELRKYGSTRHAGFGLGFARMIMYLTGVSNIRDVIPFPRTFGSADF